MIKDTGDCGQTDVREMLSSKRLLVREASSSGNYYLLTKYAFCTVIYHDQGPGVWTELARGIKCLHLFKNA